MRVRAEVVGPWMLSRRGGAVLSGICLGLEGRSSVLPCKGWRIWPLLGLRGMEVRQFRLAADDGARFES